MTWFFSNRLIEAINDWQMSAASTIAWHFPIFFFIVHLLWSQMAYLTRANVYINHLAYINEPKIDYVNGSLMRCFNKASSHHSFQPVAQKKKTQTVSTNKQTYVKQKYIFCWPFFHSHRDRDFWISILQMIWFTKRYLLFFLNYFWNCLVLDI